MYFLGGVQLLCIGIIGEYLAKIYLEVKRRPAYFVEKQVGGETAGAGQTREARSSPTHPGP
jgi:dolichol-phosphate mannosyltransferase